MKNYFNKNLYLQGLKKLKVSGLAASITIILLNAIIPIIYLIEGSDYDPSQSFYSSAKNIGCNDIVPWCLLLMLLVPILTHDMFSFLNERNKSDFYHSLPQKRSCVYLSFISAILSWAIGTIIASAAVSSVIYAIARTCTISFSTVILGIIPYIVLTVMLVGFTVLAMTLTGTIISNILVTVILLGFFRVMGLLFVYCLEDITPILSTDFSFWRFFSFEFYLPFAIFPAAFDADAEIYTNIVLLVYSFVIGVGAIALGCVSYCKRRSEIATKSAPNKWIQHIYRFAVTLPLIFTLGYSFVSEGYEDYQVVLVIVILLVYFLYELVTTKKIKSAVKALPLLLVPVLVSALLIAGAWGIGRSIENDRIDADDIESFKFAYNYYGSYESIITSDLFVSNSVANEIIEDAFDKTVDDYYKNNYRTAKLLINLKDGRTVARKLRMTTEQYNMLDSIPRTDAEYIERFVILPSPEEISDVWIPDYFGLDNKTVTELYESFYNEYNSLSQADKLVVKNFGSEWKYVASFSVEGRLNNKSYTGHYYLSFDKMPVTASLYLKAIGEDYGYGYYGQSLSRSRTELAPFAELAEKGELMYVYGSVAISPITENGVNEFKKTSYSQSMVTAINELLGVIIDSPEAFNYSDADKLCKIEIRLSATRSAESIEREPEKAEIYETSAVIVDEKYAEYADYMTDMASTEYYFSDVFFVALDDATYSQIVDLMINFE